MMLSVLRVGRGVLIAALFLGGFEGVARQRGWFDPSAEGRDDPYLGFPGTHPLFHVTAAADGSLVYATVPNKKMYRSQTFSPEKSANEYRVFCIGGSGVRSDAFMYPDGSFPNMLFLYLRAAMPDRKVTVLNCGGGGMGSVQNLEVMREILDYQPDLVVMVPEGGEKNMVPPSPQGILSKDDDASPLRVATRRVLTKLRLYQGLRRGYQACFPPRGAGSQAQASAFSAFIATMVSMPFDPQIFTRFLEFKVDRVPVLMEQPIPEAEIRHAHERFQRNLATMSRLAKDAGVPLLFVLPLRNLHASFYLKFHVTPGEIRDGEIDAWRRDYEAALALKREGKFLEAAAALRAVRTHYVRDDDDILAFYIGECLEQAGDKTGALDEFAKPYLRHPMRGQIEAVAKEHHVPVVDPYPEVLKIATDGIPGYAEFTDSVHPMPKTNRVIARSVYEQIQANGFVPGLPPLTDEKVANADRMVTSLCNQLKAPDANLMLQAILSKQYETAVRIARDYREDQMLQDEKSIEPLYYGWALTKLGRTDEARTFFLKLRAKYSSKVMQNRTLRLQNDEDFIRIAFTGDIFHWF